MCLFEYEIRITQDHETDRNTSDNIDETGQQANGHFR